MSRFLDWRFISNWEKEKLVIVQQFDLITRITKTTQQFGQNEFIAQCENCLTKYWTINKNAKVPKLECRKMESEVIEENTKRL